MPGNSYLVNGLTSNIKGFKTGSHNGHSFHFTS